MKFCQFHWDRLRKEIDVVGLGHMVLSSRAIFQQGIDQLEGRDASQAAFDPLMAMHNQIVERFLDPLGGSGLYIFTGDYCPLCELDRLNPDRNLPENWIVTGCQSLAKWCRENNMTDEALDAGELEEGKC